MNVQYIERYHELTNNAWLEVITVGILGQKAVLLHNKEDGHCHKVGTAICKKVATHVESTLDVFLIGMPSHQIHHV